MQRKTSLFVALAAALVWSTAFADPDAEARAVVVKENPAGGVTTGKFGAGRGPNGGAYAHGRVSATDGAGDAGTASAGAVRGPNGGVAARAGKTTRSADGSINHQSGFNASGSRGQVQSRGSFTKSDGSASGQRSTTATGAAGNTYQGETTYTKGEGVDHTATCTDAAGDVIPCRR